jgi:hypothetical protein
MKCAVEMDSVAMIYIPSFIKIGAGIQKLGEIHREHGDLISLLLFFLNKGSMLKYKERMFIMIEHFTVIVVHALCTGAHENLSFYMSWSQLSLKPTLPGTTC